MIWWLLIASAACAQEADERVSAVLKASDKAFFASPNAEKSLRHLRDIVSAGMARDPGFVAFADLGDKAHGRARETGGVDLNVNFSSVTIVQAQTLWHETQHVYDRIFIAASGHVHALLRPLPLEMELRGLKAGCAFWDAAKKNRQTPKDGRSADPCPAEIQPQNYCHDNWAVEEAVAAWEKLKADGKALSDVQKALSSPPDSSDPFGPESEKNFEAYCIELERASRGNPLSLAGFKFSWSLSDCLKNARTAILTPGWQSSWELCPKPDIPDPKYREVVSAWPKDFQ